MAAQSSKPSGEVSSPATPTGEESMTPVSQPSRLGELSASMFTEPDMKSEAIQRAQVGSLIGAKGNNEPQNKTPKKQSPASATRPKKYALEMCVEIKTSAGIHTSPEEDSYSVGFAIETINHAYPRCTGMYLGVAGHMLAFYGKKTNPMAGLLISHAVATTKVIANIHTWMGYFAKWRVKCISISEASEILAGCKRIEKENLRLAHWELQQRFSAMQLDSTLSATAQPFQPPVTPQSSREDDVPRSHPVRHRLAGSSPIPGYVPDSPMRRAFPSHHQSCDNNGVSTDTSISDRPPTGGEGVEGAEVARVVVTLMALTPLGEGVRKRMDFQVRSRSPNLEARRVILMMWLAPSISGLMYYWDYYEDLYLMPLVVSSLTGDASDVFDWILSLNPGNTQDLTTLLHMLREHYCGSLTFREQRNTIENLC